MFTIKDCCYIVLCSTSIRLLHHKNIPRVNFLQFDVVSLSLKTAKTWSFPNGSFKILNQKKIVEVDKMSTRPVHAHTF